jgi:hypothetical protein
LKRQKYHPYKIKLVQYLAEDDFDRRLEFCQWAVEKCDSDQHFSKKILFSDEAIFYLNGHVNRHNMRYWADSNPNWISDNNVQGDARVMVRCGILDNQIIGPYFFLTIGQWFHLFAIVAKQDLASNSSFESNLFPTRWCSGPLSQRSEDLTPQQNAR